MSRSLRKKALSYANVVSTLALVLAMSGGALAADRYLINSTKQINPKVLKQLRGASGPEGPQGPEGPEGSSSGEPAALRHWRATISAAGVSEASATTVVLAEDSPFTITGHCYDEGEDTIAQTYIASSQSSSYLRIYEEAEYLPLGAAQPLTLEAAKGETSGHEADFEGGPEGTFSASSHDGKAALDGAADQGVWLRGPTGPACSFSGYLVRE